MGLRGQSSEKLKKEASQACLLLDAFLVTINIKDNQNHHFTDK